METITLTVTKIERATEECILVFLEPENGKELSYLPGQFLTFLFNHGETRRSYSIFTTPGVDSQVAVLVKRVTNGEISRRLIDHLSPGDKLEAIPPTGRFILPSDRDRSEPLIFIAAGSGISPVFSLIKEALSTEGTGSVSLVYQNRNEQSTLFRQELDLLSNKYSGRFTWTNLLSAPAELHHNATRLNNTLLEKILFDMRVNFTNTRFYLCGPPAFMRMCQFVLHVLGSHDDRIHKEIFYFESGPSNPLAHLREPRTVQLQWNKGNFNFTVKYPESILDAALKAGIKLPYSCRGGRCSTCTVKCTTGKVIMSINEVLTKRDLKNGLVLTCVGYPETDISLEYPF